MLGPKSQIVPAPGCVAHPKRRIDKPGDPEPTTQPHPSYSVDKFRDLCSYCVAVPPWRMFWVCVSLPLPALAAAIVPVFLPLQHPRFGPTVGYYAHASFINFTTSLACLLHWTTATHISRETFTLRQIVIVSGLSSLLLITQFVILTKYWMFPIPFTSVTCSWFWCFDILVALAIVLGRRLWQTALFRQSFKLYGPCMVLQTAQIAIYPAINVLYDRCNDVQRVIITLIFPAVKYGLKRLLLYFGGELGDFQTEVAVSGVEICASLYQSMIMQSAPSPVAMAFIMGLDVLQGIFAIKIFADRHSEPSTPRNQLFQEAERILATTPEPSSTSQLIEEQSDEQKRHKCILNSALRLANTAESILLVEYYEVIIPIVNGLFLLVASQTSSAQYNSRISPFYRNPGHLTSALSSVALYSLLQGLSCVAMHFVMKRRYGISAAAHLAFVLERYHQSILGMMLAWLPLILHFTLMHYGPDFSFRFRLQDDSW